MLIFALIMAKAVVKHNINRIRVVLAEKERKNIWLAEKLEVNPITVSKWCSNSSQPSLETLVKIANTLDVDITELLNNTKK